MRSSGFALLALCLLCSCGDAVPADVFSVADSAGIAIVTNSTDRLSAVPIWSLLEDSLLNRGLHSKDAPVFFRVTDILSLPGGEVAVLDAGTCEISILDGTGGLLERLGREGDGPGEFREPISLVLLPPDSVGVYDASSDRLSVFERTGALARVERIEDVPSTGGVERVYPSSAGGFVLFTWGGFTAERDVEGIFRGSAKCIRVSGTGQRTGSCGGFPGPEVFIENGKMGYPFFGTDTHVATSGDLLIVGTAEETEWRGFTPEGALSTIVRWPDRERTVTQERVDGLIDTLASQLFPEQRAQVREVLSERPWSPRAPAYLGILASDGGEIWVGEYPGPAAGYLELPPPARRWLVFQASGELIAMLETPTGFQPLALGRDAVFGVFRDDLGVEVPRKYWVVKEKNREG